MNKELLSVVAFLATKGYADGLQDEKFKELKAEEQAKLFDELNENNREAVNEMISEKATKAEIDKALQEMQEGQVAQMKSLNSAIQEIGLAVKQINESNKPMNDDQKKTLRSLIEANSETFKKIKANKENASLVKELASKVAMDVTKASGGSVEVASDIGDRDYLGTIEPGITHKPVRRTKIIDLFRRKPVNSEYLHYWEEDVVTRDAKFVIACATSTHTTKKTWAKRTVELAKIRDMVDVCIDMLEDYAFVESELKQLVDESIMLLAEYELLLGEFAAATDMESIDSIASEFNASNVLADFSGKFSLPTIGDLTAAMKGQIFEFGQQAAWEADTIVMNYTDMIVYLHAKDANGVYLFPNFVLGATDMINGMKVITSPIVAQNTLYVFDSTKGSILDRKKLSITASYENDTNFENELVTFKGVARLQFYVKNINKDAFMKCSDISTALAAIDTAS